jgi:hypothetical protein
MARCASRLLGSVFVFGFAIGCGDDGRVFDGGSVSDGGGTADSGDAGGELATGEITIELTDGATEAVSTESRRDGGVIIPDASSSGESATSAFDDSETSTGDASTGDTTNGDASTADAASDVDTTSDVTSEQSTAGETTEPSVVVTVEADGDGDLVGFVATLAAAASASDGSTVTYSWALVSKPDGSHVANGDIVASDATASFYPDRAGDYVVRVTAATEAGDQASQDVTVQARAYDVGYLNVAGDQDSWTYAGFMVKSDSTDARQVGCYFQNTAASESEWLSSFQQQGKLSLMPYLPNDGSTPARIAYSRQSTDSSYQMFIAGPNNDCNGNPPPQVVGGLFPTFSPNGQRVAVITQEVVADPANEGQTLTVSNIVTYHVDGTDARLLRADYGGGTSGVSWVDDETLVWIEPAEDNSTRAYRTKDVANAFDNDLLSEVILDCAGAANPIPTNINHAVERGGALFVASSYTAIFSGTSAYSIWRLLPTGSGTYDCNQDAPTNVKVAGDDAHDFDVSLDGTKLLYFSTVAASETETSASLLFLRDLETMNEPLVLSAEPSTIASGAHFSAGGRQLVWTETKQVNTTVGETTYERPEQSRVIVANADGNNKRTLVTVSSSGSQARMFHTGGNSFCSVGFVGTPGFVGVGGVSSLIAFASVVWRRRRRSSAA